VTARNRKTRRGPGLSGKATTSTSKDSAPLAEDQPLFVVLTQKRAGAEIVFGRYRDRVEADRVCSMLKWAGAVAHVEPPIDTVR